MQMYIIPTKFLNTKNSSFISKLILGDAKEKVYPHIWLKQLISIAEKES